METNGRVMMWVRVWGATNGSLSHSLERIGLPSLEKPHLFIRNGKCACAGYHKDTGSVTVKTGPTMTVAHQRWSSDRTP